MSADAPAPADLALDTDLTVWDKLLESFRRDFVPGRSVAQPRSSCLSIPYRTSVADSFVETTGNHVNCVFDFLDKHETKFVAKVEQAAVFQRMFSDR